MAVKVARKLLKDGDMGLDMFGAKQGPKSNSTSKEKCLHVKYSLIHKNEVGGPGLVNSGPSNWY
jgi:hypothetical protein